MPVKIIKRVGSKSVVRRLGSSLTKKSKRNTLRTRYGKTLADAISRRHSWKKLSLQKKTEIRKMIGERLSRLDDEQIKQLLAELSKKRQRAGKKEKTPHKKK